MRVRWERERLPAPRTCLSPGGRWTLQRPAGGGDQVRCLAARKVQTAETQTLASTFSQNRRSRPSQSRNPTVKSSLSPGPRSRDQRGSYYLADTDAFWHHLLAPAPSPRSMFTHASRRRLQALSLEGGVLPVPPVLQSPPGMKGGGQAVQPCSCVWLLCCA